MIYLLRAKIQQNHQTNGSVVVDGVEPSIEAYETFTIPSIVHNLNNWVVVSGIEPLSRVLQTLRQPSWLTTI